MASSPFLSYLLFGSLLYLSCLNNVFCLEKSFGFEEKVTSQTLHTVQLLSLLPSTICSHSTKVENNKRSVVKVVEKHGPCSQLYKDETTRAPTPAEILEQDQDRVNSIQSRLSKKPIETDATTIPAKSGEPIGSGNYIVTVGLGTPKRDLSLAFDTGSDITWTQCLPCNATSCYPQKEPLFDPTKSTSYSNISCTASEQCSQLTSSTPTRCSSITSTCIYGIQYGDKSFSIGYLSKERITLSPSDVFNDFLFGCGRNNQGLFRGIAGLLGLGRDKISLVEQTAQKYNRIFSYCLPPTSSSTGYLTFGKEDKPASDIKYTPLTTLSQGDSFYGLQLQGISVGGSQVPIPASVFSSGTVIDSGTVITRLPATAYSAFRSEFRQQMKDYKLITVTPNFLLDTCYDFSGHAEVKIPKISFLFGGGTMVDLDVTGILVVLSKSQICLAFAGNKDDSDIAIFGNVQQKRFEVVYDIVGVRIGFRSAAC
ncbi:aspartyl protease family protein At5g10770 [Ziziphus jujuba]|uniref:Aspartyl protease family protein At5g10770 n=2 Tax=Ziziphus jujuba TaxID=326968 RepID=A0ABM3ILL0_ZIZJJ|nr:aspartyl protease family protein At5g10770 [Ziziphus jujuba]KAH7523927.1 hypothetical protein FEM48_Zijuj06G0064000 [Ziziphus jujuba var. spinosa]